MKALVLTYDRYRRVTEHMLKTYAVHWPKNNLTFRIPYQYDMQLKAYGQSVELVQTSKAIKETVSGLLKGLADDEWIYWCVDDKYVVAVDAAAASYFSEWVARVGDPAISGLCFCRARRLLQPDSASVTPMAHTTRGDELLLRYNYRQIWLHQFLRVRVLRVLFDAFPNEDFEAKEMDGFKDKVEILRDTNLYVTEKNYAVFGESTVAGKLTSGCLASMRDLSVEIPEGFDIFDADIRIGSLPGIIGE